MKHRKYTYEKIIQQNAGQGWEDVSSYPATSQGLALDRATRELLRHDFREYARMGYPARVIFRRSLSPVYRNAVKPLIGEPE
jgi:hypothetical protein